jgi:hypothetical protein
LKKIVDLLLKKWYRSIVAPGEMVGTIAAQSIGEPTTQVSLCTQTPVFLLLTDLFSFYTDDFKYFPPGREFRQKRHVGRTQIRRTY